MSHEPYSHIHTILSFPTDMGEFKFTVLKDRKNMGCSVNGTGPTGREYETAVLEHTLLRLIAQGVDSEGLYSIATAVLEALVKSAVATRNVGRPPNQGLKLVKPFDPMNPEVLKPIAEPKEGEELPTDAVMPGIKDATDGDLHADGQRLAALADIPDDTPVSTGNKMFTVGEVTLDPKTGVVKADVHIDATKLSAKEQARISGMTKHDWFTREEKKETATKVVEDVFDRKETGAHPSDYKREYRRRNDD